MGIITLLEGCSMGQSHQRRLMDARRKSGGDLRGVRMSLGGRGPDGGGLDGRHNDKRALRHKQTRAQVSEAMREDQSLLQS